ncbi:hypothetical protein [Symbiopectobacterium sp. RP]|uniref:hypothetical protein n=1 Tax=Symbiopectobacterium sp. RP TaxID=3248553 RepID=UPI003D27C288
MDDFVLFASLTAEVKLWVKRALKESSSVDVAILLIMMVFCDHGGSRGVKTVAYRRQRFLLYSVSCATSLFRSRIGKRLSANWPKMFYV